MECKKYFNKILGAFIFILLLCKLWILPAQGLTVVNDHFDDNVLDAAWSVNLLNATGWTYTESGTNLNVTDIVPTVINTGNGGTWAEVLLRQTFTPLTDFNTEFDISWDSEYKANAMQKLYISLYDSSGSVMSMAQACYSDRWVILRASKYATVGTNVYDSGSSTLPLSGSASIDITRVGDNIEVWWDGSMLLSGTNANPLGKVDIGFSYYAYDGPGGVSFFANESVDLVKIEGTCSPVPEPSTWLLLFFGLIGLVGIKKKFS